MEEPADSKLGEFRILSRIKVGQGTQGAVYKAVCESDSFPRCPRGTVVALKAMPVAAESDRLFEKLQRNVETLAEADHPNIVRYLGCFVAQISFSEQLVIIQEYLDGETLAARLADGRSGLDSDEALRVVKGMVAGLAAAVKRGIIHRDVKPANVFLCDDGSVKLIDFEVSRRADGSVTTSSGNMVGSYDYMAPEFTDPSFCGDEQSDIFSVGVVMHEVFTGTIPYQRGTAVAGKLNLSFFERWARDANGQLVNGGCRISYRIERIVSHAKSVLLKALAADRSDRFASFAEFEEALAGVRFRELKGEKNRYQILQFIGKGGFGEVFKARQNKDGRLVAVKHLLKPDYAARFYREARIMSELRDPCFVRFLEFIAIDRPGAREAFLVMDFLPGMPGNSLRDAIRRSAGNGIDFETTVKAFIRYAHGLGVLHGRGIYHRDIKPSNLYFPEGRPDEAAIMDLGIARDENGTKTNGQVPGTLDYMPPETAFGGTRGDATMDIYALGLCFYESLTGKKAFPSLPSGSAAFAQFFRRAREKTPPVFDDERVTSRPELLKLLVHMTEPDCNLRMSDVGELEDSLKRLIEKPADVSESEAAGRGETTHSETTATGISAAETGASDEPSEPTQDDAEVDADTGETVFVHPSQMAKMIENAGSGKPVQDNIGKDRSTKGKKRKHKGKSVRSDGKKGEPSQWTVRKSVILAFAVAEAVLVAFGFFVVPAICDWFNGFLSGQRRAARMANLSISDGIRLGVDDLYGDDSISLEQADALRDRWLAERRPPVLSKAEYDRIVSNLREKRNQRIVRERLDEEKSRIDRGARAVIQAYRDDGVPAGDKSRDEWLREWSGAAKEKVENATKRIAVAREARIAYDAAKARVPEAEAEAGGISRNYAIEDFVISEKNAEGWRKRWDSRLPKDDYERIDAMLLDAQKRAREKQAAKISKSALDSCRAAIEMITPVESRMNRLAEAETMLKSAIAAGYVDPAAAEALLEEIARRRAWTVFEVENRSDLDLDVAGEKLANGSVRLFVYTNSVPADLAATHAGYEPFVFGPQLNGHKVSLLPEHFTMLRVLMKQAQLEEGVTCRVDGVMVRNGEVRLMPGTHECVYSRPGYKNQSLPFRVEPNDPSFLPSPGPWVRTDEWLQRPAPVTVAIPKLSDGISCTVDGASVTGSVTVLPGDHVCVFSRPEFLDIRHDITVRVGEPISIPAPYRWKETDGLAALVAAEVAVERDDWNTARAELSAADVKGEDSLKRKRALEERIERHKRFLMRLDDAAAASLDARWMDVVKVYADMVGNGYVITEEDRRRIGNAARNASDNLQMRRQTAVKSGSDLAVRTVDAEISRLKSLLTAIRSAPASGEERKRAGSASEKK